MTHILVVDNSCRIRLQVHSTGGLPAVRLSFLEVTAKLNNDTLAILAENYWQLRNVESMTIKLSQVMRLLTYYPVPSPEFIYV